MEAKKTVNTGSNGSGSGIAATAQRSGLSVSLHPLVIMNISEHWTRTKAQVGCSLKVYGALFGQQQGRTVEIMNSFELDYFFVERKVVINLKYYSLKEGQFKQVFPDMEFLGWYSTGESPTDDDLSLQAQIYAINASPIFLQLNPSATTSASELPVSLYESGIDISRGFASMGFLPLRYSLATEEAERIGLDHVAHSGSVAENGANASASKVAAHLSVQHSAIQMLALR